MPAAHLSGMKTPRIPAPAGRGRLVVLIVAGVVLVLLVGVGVYGLIAGPRTTHHPASGDGQTPGPVPTLSAGPSGDVTPRLPKVVASSDPETFARNVATALFSWDTGSGFMPLDYTSVILAVGDPSGTEQAGLASDVATYLPNQDAWVQLRQYATRQHLTIDKAYVPKAWGEAVAQAHPGQLAPGTVAYTIEGTRHRDGVWNDQTVTSSHPVSFTVFIVCAPSYPTCHLLRLSELDDPLH